MSIIKLNDLYFKPYISKEKITKVVKYLANNVKEDLPDNEVPIFVGILNGCFLFAADFIREFRGDCEVSFVKIASYEGTSSSNKIKKLVGINEDLMGRTVIILEDIIDTGNTLQEIYNIFRDKELKELKVVSLFFKPDVFRKELPIDYIGLNIEDKFIVGYGLDYNGLGRNYPEIYQLTKKPKMKNIVLFGPPGAGKGTQSENIIQKYGLKHISTGDLFRKHLGEGTELGKKAQSYMDNGKLVPDEVVIGMVDDFLNANTDAKGFIFDGFPRTVAQADALDALLANHNTKINCMVMLDVPQEELKRRLLERGKTSGRADDQNEEKINTRIQEYLNKTLPVAAFYEGQDKKAKINGVGTIEGIFEDIASEIDNHL